MKRFTIPIALLATLIQTLPAIAAWKYDDATKTIWQAGFVPSGPSTVGYDGLVKSKSAKADTCKVIKIPGKKNAAGGYNTAQGPIKIGSTTYGSGFSTAPGTGTYKCQKNSAGVKVACFLTGTNCTPGLNGQADLKGNLYFAPIGITAGNSYPIEWRYHATRKVKANACGVVYLKPNKTYTNLVGSVNGEAITSMVSQAAPGCKAGVIQ